MMKVKAGRQKQSRKRPEKALKRSKARGTPQGQRKAENGQNESHTDGRRADDQRTDRNRPQQQEQSARQGNPHRQAGKAHTDELHESAAQFHDGRKAAGSNRKRRVVRSLKTIKARQKPPRKAEKGKRARFTDNRIM